MALRVATTSRGGKCIFYDQFQFRIDKKIGEKIHWKCVKKGCSSRCSTTHDMTTIVKEPGPHTHTGEDGEVGAKVLVSKMKRKCFDEPERPTKQIYNESLREMNAASNADDLAHHFPQFHQIKSSLYRQRRKLMPTLPSKLSDVDLTPQFTETTNGRPFLLANDGEDDKILVFGTYENVHRLCNAPKIFMDGTFWVSPTIFEQLFTIHVVEYGITVPVIYALLPNKTRKTYSRLFQLLKRASPKVNETLNPADVSMDFELACLQAFRTLFPSAGVDGCMFHFSQCIWRKTQEYGLTTEYKENKDVKQCVRRLCALCFVPLERLDEAWLQVSAAAPEDDRITKLTDYFVRTWFDDISALHRYSERHERWLKALATIICPVSRRRTRFNFSRGLHR